MLDMKPVEAGDRRVANIHTAKFTEFVYPDGLALGDAILQHDTDLPLGTGFHVYRMPGMECVAKLPHPSSIGDFEFSPGGDELAIASAPGSEAAYQSHDVMLRIDLGF